MMSGSFPSAAAGGPRASVSAAGSGELPPYTALQLGPERAALARALRQRLTAAGIAWPPSIDARPGRLQVILGDCTDPPLGATAAALVARHGELVLDGMAALGLITAVSRLVLCASAPATVTALQTLCAERSVSVVKTPAVYPACPESDVPAASGHAYTVAAAQLAQIGALVRGLPAPRLCTVAGVVAQPQVLELPLASRDLAPAAARSPDLASAAECTTPAALVRRCGGTQGVAWVAVAGGALGGVLWPAEAPLPTGTSLCLILPVTHPLVARLRRGDQWLTRARNACLSCRLCTDFCPVAQTGVPLMPHRLMREIAGEWPLADLTGTDEVSASVRSATACTGCGACSVMCPAELLPGAAVRSLGAALASRQGGDAALSSPRPPEDDSQPSPLGDRRVPLPLLLARLGLSAYVPPG